MSKKKFYSDQNTALLEGNIRQALRNKYFNYFMNTVKWNGIEDEAADYIMRQFWKKGTVSAFSIAGADMIGFAPYYEKTWTMYNTASTIQLINERSVPFIPSKDLVVNRDAVIGWFQKNHKPVSFMVDYYIDRMVETLMTLNTNLNVQKMPLLISVNEEDVDTCKDIIDKILNNETAVFLASEQANNIKVLNNGTPYIIDKLYAQYSNWEEELKTYLGIDTANTNMNRMTVDQVNSNNVEINNNAEGFIIELERFCKKISEVLGYNVSVELTHKPAEAEASNQDNELESEVNADE